MKIVQKYTTRLHANLQDSVKEILQIIRIEKPFQTDIIAGKTTADYCRSLWYFAKNNINYQPDANGTDQIRTPNRTWKDRKQGVDCEDYVGFLGTLLKKRKAKQFLRIVSYDKNRGFEHIYTVVKDGKDEIVLDVCMNDFNTEMPYYQKIDIDVQNPNLALIPKAGSYPLTVLSGLPNKSVKEILAYEGKGGQGKQVGVQDGILHEYFTPEWIVKLMWDLCIHYGFQGGNVLEPSCGTGRFMHYAPKNLRIDFTAFERDPMLAELAAEVAPKATIYNNDFETAFLKKIGDFYEGIKKEGSWLPKMDLVIGNPPYGLWKGDYKKDFNLKGVNQVEQFFMLQGLKMLKKDGLLCFITSSAFISTYDKYYQTKSDMNELCTVVDAYRLPSVFANTDVPTDILIFRKK